MNIVKKIGWLFIFSVLFIFPINVQAKEGITHYFIDATVENNGDLRVKEMFTMNGSFNGFERIINYRNSSTNPFDGSLESFQGSSIYNADNIIIKEVKGIPVDSSINFDYLNHTGDVFQKVNNANTGDYGKYIENTTYDGITLMIYNPSKNKTAFYIEYIIKNIGIVHQDIAEIGWNLFTSLREDTFNLEMKIHIPNNKELLRAWAHGPLNGEIKIIDKNTINVTLQELYANDAVDVRFAFDKTVLNQSKKTTNVEALDKIIQVETKLADEANDLREQAREEVRKENQMKVVFYCIQGLWLAGLIAVIIYIYKKYDKEYKSSFTGKYYRDFPESYSPSTVGYLLHKQVSNDDLSASLLNLINKKIVTFEKLPDKKEDYLLKYENKELTLTESETNLIDFLFEESEIKLSDLKKKAKKNYESFIKKYTKWKTKATEEACNEGFYESHGGTRTLAILYSISGFFIAIMTMPLTTGTSMMQVVASFLSLFYFAAFTKRSQKGNDQYVKWIALKNFMEDFGTMDKKELPEIILWEKYLVYAVTLGCADKLAKTMRLRIEDFKEYQSMSTGNIIFDYYRFNTMMTFNRIINESINSSVSSAYSAQSIANSSNSSGSGFGGGFSGGGGSFGGGGGGGRF